MYVKNFFFKKMVITKSTLDNNPAKLMQNKNK